MRRCNCPLVWVLIFALSGEACPQTLSNRSVAISRADLCVTEGAIAELPGHRLSVTVPKMRAYLNVPSPQFLEARFTYAGSTGNEARLGSGELRRQFGLKLHAQDACNLIYAMWRIEPESKVVVSVKSNPGQHASSQCGNRGYRNIKPAFSKLVPTPVPGQHHSLRAEMNGPRLQVFVDNSLAWDGSVGPDAQALRGPVGIRSDNAKLELELFARLSQNPGSPMPVCPSGPQESE